MVFVSGLSRTRFAIADGDSHSYSGCSLRRKRDSRDCRLRPRYRPTRCDNTNQNLRRGKEPQEAIRIARRGLPKNTNRFQLHPLRIPLRIWMLRMVSKTGWLEWPTAMMGQIDR